MQITNNYFDYRNYSNSDSLLKRIENMIKDITSSKTGIDFDSSIKTFKNLTSKISNKTNSNNVKQQIETLKDKLSKVSNIQNIYTFKTSSGNIINKAI